MKRLLELIILVLLISSLSYLSFGKEPKLKMQSEKKEKKDQGKNNHNTLNYDSLLGQGILGNLTDTSASINILTSKGMSVYVEYKKDKSPYIQKSEFKISEEGEPVEIVLTNLEKNTKYNYIIKYRVSKNSEYVSSNEKNFYTQRTVGESFSFGVQGDSHPEREGKMFNSTLYKLTVDNAKKVNLDFYFLLGDDFSIEKLISDKTYTEKTVNDVYINQRQYLREIGGSSGIFLVNGNHEQAAKYLLDGTDNSPAILAAKARINYFSLPEPNNFFGGDKEKVQGIYLKDYYSFTWGDALFIVIDPYWHSESAVDNDSNEKDKKNKRNLWNITLGDTQYNWFKETLEKSKSKYKFVFAHHVSGTGRGGIENAKLYEWGGYGKNGVWEFGKNRPNWELPIHQLMVKNGVTIFFQGHDHLFAKQELDGIIYQTVPSPADDSYSAFNKESYMSGELYGNSGYLNVTVSNNSVKVDYIRSFLSKDENDINKNGKIEYSYEIKK